MTAATADKTVLIAGGGIAGLTTALCAHKAGYSPRVFERTDALSEIGAGLQIGANAMKVLNALGLAQNVVEAGHRPASLDLVRGHDGARIFSVPAGDAARQRWGGDHVNIRRAVLQRILADALAQRCPGALRLGAEVMDFATQANSVEVALSHGGTERGAALFICDGIHSNLRDPICGRDAPLYTGHTALRSVVRATPELRELIPDASTAWTGKTCHAVTYYLNDRRDINFVGVIERDEPTPEGWHTTARIEEARSAFAGFAKPIRALLAAATTARLWGLYDRPPPPHLAARRAALIGDSAMPMPPFMAQGASFAMECAWSAVWSLREKGHFNAYDLDRRLRGARILGAARRNGNFFHGRGLPTLFGYGPVRLVAKITPEAIAGRFDWIYGEDVTAKHPLDGSVHHDPSPP